MGLTSHGIWGYQVCVIYQKIPRLPGPHDCLLLEKDGPQYILKDWPDGYMLFIHCKGNRRDKYLYGELQLSPTQSCNLKGLYTKARRTLDIALRQSFCPMPNGCAPVHFPSRSAAAVIVNTTNVRRVPRREVLAIRPTPSAPKKLARQRRPPVFRV